MHITCTDMSVGKTHPSPNTPHSQEIQKCQPHIKMFINIDEFMMDHPDEAINVCLFLVFSFLGCCFFDRVVSKIDRFNSPLFLSNVVEHSVQKGFSHAVQIINSHTGKLVYKCMICEGKC